MMTLIEEQEGTAAIKSEVNALNADVDYYHCSASSVTCSSSVPLTSKLPLKLLVMLYDQILCKCACFRLQLGISKEKAALTSSSLEIICK